MESTKELSGDSVPKPVSAKERLEFLDVLRGAALLGVLIANAVWFFSGYGDLSEAEKLSLPTANLDGTVLSIEYFFVVNKFITIFSFLFGVGFALQMQHTALGDHEIRRLYVRRMMWLLMFGIIHTFFIWPGDILHLYAILGLALIPCVTLSNRALVSLGIAFAIFAPVVVDVMQSVLPLISGGVINPEESFAANWALADLYRSAFLNGSYVEVVQANVMDFWAWLTTDDALVTGLASFGKFLLGFWAGRNSILVLECASLSTSSASKHAVLLVRSGMIWGFVIGLTCQSILLMKGWLPFIDSEIWFAKITRGLLWQTGVLALAMAYVCSIVLFVRGSGGLRTRKFFAPVGRMALTNYLGQSVICVVIFYGIGFGWYGHVGPTVTVGLVLLIFSVQSIFSAWWLQHYRFGPTEWLWRSLTYAKRQPFKRKHLNGDP